jgi:hypothetical protein
VEHGKPVAMVISVVSFVLFFLVVYSSVDGEPLSERRDSGIG